MILIILLKMDNSCWCSNIHNHNIIDESNNTILNKLLQHYFNQITNSSLLFNCDYCEDLFDLDLNIINPLINNATIEEIDVINILKYKYNNDKIKQLTETWEGYNKIKQNKIFNLGLENKWNYKEMIGMLWETHWNY